MCAFVHRSRLRNLFWFRKRKWFRKRWSLSVRNTWVRLRNPKKVSQTRALKKTVARHEQGFSMHRALGENKKARVFHPGLNITFSMND